MLNQPERLKSPWSSPKAQGLIGLVLGLTFTVQAVSAETFNWLRWLQLVAGVILAIGGIYTLATASKRDK